MVTTTNNAFLQAIIDNPDDDTLRLIYADWLEGQGDTARAEFIRVQCELVTYRRDSCPNSRTVHEEIDLITTRGPVPVELAVGRTCGRCRWCLLTQRERELLDQWGNSLEWLGHELRGIWRSNSHYLRISYRRGFVEAITCPCGLWLRCGAKIVEACPTIREVWLSDKRPRHFAGEMHGWSDNDYDGEYGDSWIVPIEIFMHFNFILGDYSGIGRCWYESELTAYKELSQACIAYAQNQLKLTSR